MPLTQFQCPDGEYIDIEDCLEQCRMGSRCLSLPTLRVAGRDREWDGIPHVTNLLNGTMLEMLKIHNDYAIDPKSRAFSMLGSTHHKLLEEYADGDSEIGLVYGDPPWIQGTADYLEVDGDDIVLWDYKTWGSYRVKRALGIHKSGGKVYTGGKPDLEHEELQLNMYRIMIEEAQDIHIDRIQLQVTVRDGGIRAAVESGVDQSIYIIPIRRLNDEYVLDWFVNKAIKLLGAVYTKEADICTKEERWDDNRCKKYCEVAACCPYGSRLISVNGR